MLVAPRICILSVTVSHSGIHQSYSHLGRTLYHCCIQPISSYRVFLAKNGRHGRIPYLFMAAVKSFMMKTTSLKRTASAVDCPQVDKQGGGNYDGLYLALANTVRWWDSVGPDEDWFVYWPSTYWRRRWWSLWWLTTSWPACCVYGQRRWQWQLSLFLMNQGSSELRCSLLTMLS